MIYDFVCLFDDPLEEIAAEFHEASRLLDEARSAVAGRDREVLVNGRIVESSFWDTALKVRF